VSKEQDIEQALVALGRAVNKVDPGGAVIVRMRGPVIATLEEQLRGRDVATVGEALDHRDATTGDLVILGGVTVIVRPIP
jgi:hypothetical protein